MPMLSIIFLDIFKMCSFQFKFESTTYYSDKEKRGLRHTFAMREIEKNWSYVCLTIGC